MQRSIVIYDGRAYRPAGFREPMPGDLYLAPNGEVLLVPRKRAKTWAPGRRTILREFVEPGCPEDGSEENL